MKANKKLSIIVTNCNIKLLFILIQNFLSFYEPSARPTILIGCPRRASRSSLFPVPAIPTRTISGTVTFSFMLQKKSKRNFTKERCVFCHVHIQASDRVPTTATTATTIKTATLSDTIFCLFFFAVGFLCNVYCLPCCKRVSESIMIKIESRFWLQDLLQWAVAYVTIRFTCLGTFIFGRCGKRDFD